MLLERPGTPLRATRVRRRLPGAGQVLVKVTACGVCRTDLHVVDGELTEPKLPIIPGHEIVGRVESVGAGVEQFRRGDRVGIPWLGHTCGACPYCLAGDENLCDAPRFTGYSDRRRLRRVRDCGGPLLLCAARRATPTSRRRRCCAPGLIGYRSLRMAGEAARLGIYGFGAAAHIVGAGGPASGPLGLRIHPAGRCRGAGVRAPLGCAWAGGSDDAPPVPLDAAIIFAPVGALVPAALARCAQGGHGGAPAAST